MNRKRINNKLHYSCRYWATKCWTSVKGGWRAGDQLMFIDVLDNAVMDWITGGWGTPSSQQRTPPQLF